MLGSRFYLIRATMQPKPWLLTRRSNCRVMPAQTAVVDIVQTILSEHGYSDLKIQLSGIYQPREYCVQYRETDFNFISRLLEEEGIYYFFEHTASSHSMVLCDSLSAHAPMPGISVINYTASTGLSPATEYIYDWRLNQEIRPGKYTLKDYDFLQPSAPLKEEFILAATHPQHDKEMYDYPGGYTQASNNGQTYAKIRMEEQRAEFERVQALGNVRNLATGFKFTFAGYPRTDQNAEHLVVATHLQIQINSYAAYGIPDGGEEFSSSYEVLNTSFVYRSPRYTPKPVVQGVQTAVVVGNSGDEITTDEYGRVKVQFPWDRLGTNDQNSSCWIRVAQIWAGKNWGGLFIPRIGMEVVVDFLEGNPDNPIIIGCVYNGTQTTPYTLPDNKTQSGILTRSTTSGGSDTANHLRFEDKKGSEEILLHAEKDFTFEVENNDNQTIGSSKSDDGSQTVSIYNKRTVTIDQSDDTLTLKNGNRAATISKGNDTLDINQGNRTTTLSQGNDTLTLNTGNLSIETKAGSITLKAGQNTVTIDQSGITIKGLMVSIQGQTQAELKSPMTTVSGDGTLTAKGGVVMIN
jgi:type VI secretion system secreted protein VgrG